MISSRDRPDLTLLSLGTLAAAANVAAWRTGRYDLSGAAALELLCTTAAGLAVAGALGRRSRAAALWSVGTLAATCAAVSVAYLGTLCLGGEVGRVDAPPWLSVVVGLVLVVATPLAAPVLAWCALGLALLHERIPSARFAVPVLVLACFAVALILAPPVRACTN